jgi:Ala-tRNA(Pro) deacylase
VGAIPPIGLLYDIDTIVDDALLEQPEVYFEAGDHEQLIHMRSEDFRKLLGDATHAQMSHRV